jgi:hypothetical protein
LKKDVFKLDGDTKLKLVATHKKTGKTFEKEILYKDWIVFKRNKDYLYLTYQL